MPGQKVGNRLLAYGGATQLYRFLEIDPGGWNTGPRVQQHGIPGLRPLSEVDAEVMNEYYFFQQFL